MSVQNTWKDRFAQILRDAPGIKITSNEIICEPCSWSLDTVRQARNIKNLTAKHCSSLAHDEKTQWKLVEDSENSYRLQFRKKQRKIKTFLSDFQLKNVSESIEAPAKQSTPHLDVSQEIPTDFQCVTSSLKKPANQKRRRINDEATTYSKDELNEKEFGVPDLADTLMIKPKLRTEERYGLLSNSPFVVNVVQNIIERGSTEEPNRKAHNAVVRDTIVKFALTHGTAAALDLSNLINGPKRSSIVNYCRTTDPVLGWLDDDNMESHVSTAKSKFFMY